MANKSRKKKIQQAIDLVRSGKPYRHASDVTKIPRSTINSRINSQLLLEQRARVIHSRRDSLKPVEDLVAALLTRYAERGLPLLRPLLKEAIEIFISRMLPVRRFFLKSRAIGICAIARRHRDKIRFVKRQEDDRF